MKYNLRVIKNTDGSECSFCNAKVAFRLIADRPGSSEKAFFLDFCPRCGNDLDNEIKCFLPLGDILDKAKFLQLVREAEAKVIVLHEGAKDRFHHEVITARLKATGSPNIALPQENNTAIVVLNYRKGLADALRLYKELIAKLEGKELPQEPNSTLVVTDLDN